MHPERLTYLAGRHAPTRAVVRCDAPPGGTSTLTLECGHTSSVVSHFDASLTKESRCRACGRAYVLAAPEYAAEF